MHGVDTLTSITRPNAQVEAIWRLEPPRGSKPLKWLDAHRSLIFTTRLERDPSPVRATDFRLTSFGILYRLYLRFTLSHSDVEDLLPERGLMVSNESIRRVQIRNYNCLNLRAMWPKVHSR